MSYLYQVLATKTEQWRPMCSLNFKFRNWNRGSAIQIPTIGILAMTGKQKAVTVTPWALSVPETDGKGGLLVWV